MKRLCTICARGGSKGVPGKNIRPLVGRPLLEWSIEEARHSGLFAAIAVSSDSQDVLEVAARAGVDVLVKRPGWMASDTAAKLPAIAHCLLSAESELGATFSVFVDLDATSPLRTKEDIVGAVKLHQETGATSVITGARARRSPYFNLVELDEAGVVRLSKPPKEPIVRRQDAPRCFDMNASIYVWRRDPFLARPSVFYDDTRLFEMPESRSIDIDSALDWEIVEILMEREINKKNSC